MGQWISNGCSPANNPRVWDVLVYLLQDRGPGTDAVVRLTAAVALRECVDVRLDPRWSKNLLTKYRRSLTCQSVEFDANVFAPYVAPAVNELVVIIGEADTMDSKRRIAASLNAVIERAEIRVGSTSHLFSVRINGKYRSCLSFRLFPQLFHGTVRHRSY